MQQRLDGSPDTIRKLCETCQFPPDTFAKTTYARSPDGRFVLADESFSIEQVNREPIPALRGCIDVDIWPTPMTNSLPIWRTEWTDQPTRFAMAWIDATTMEFKRSEQIYTKLNAGSFRFQSADFEAVLSVDADGLVVDYPGLFKRAP